MNKSTPISQLPSSDNSIQGDIIEDDATVQEVLSQISQSSPSEQVIHHTDVFDILHAQPQSSTYAQQLGTSQQQQQHQQQQQFQQHQQHYLAQQMAQHTQQLPGPASAQAQPFYFQLPYQSSHTAVQQSAPAIESTNVSSTDSISGEVRLIILVVIVAIIIQIIPIDLLINRIDFLTKIPYSPIFVKAFIAGALFFAIRKYIS